jgi:RHS repeat-associated protein
MTMTGGGCSDDAPRSHVDASCVSNHYKFTGKEREAESGLDYFGARHYASTMGRFMSPDPSGLLAQNPAELESLRICSRVPHLFAPANRWDCNLNKRLSSSKLLNTESKPLISQHFHFRLIRSTSARICHTRSRVGSVDSHRVENHNRG